MPNKLLNEHWCFPIFYSSICPRDAVSLVFNITRQCPPIISQDCGTMLGYRAICGDQV